MILRELIEKKGNPQLYEEQISLVENSELEPDSADDVATPYSCFKYFFTDGLMANIVDEPIPSA